MSLNMGLKSKRITVFSQELLFFVKFAPVVTCRNSLSPSLSIYIHTYTHIYAHINI